MHQVTTTITSHTLTAPHKPTTCPIQSPHTQHSAPIPARTGSKLGEKPGCVLRTHTPRSSKLHPVACAGKTSPYNMQRTPVACAGKTAPYNVQHQLPVKGREENITIQRAPFILYLLVLLLSPSRMLAVIPSISPSGDLLFN